MTAVEQAPAAPPAPTRPAGDPYVWWLLAFLVIASTVSYVDRQILALMIGPVKRDLGISDTQVGLLIGLAFSAFYSIAMLPMAWLADAGPRRTVIGVGFFAWSLMTTLSGLAHNFGQLFAARMAVGVGEAALGPAAYSLLADTVRRDQLPFAIGVFATAPFIGIGLANMVGGPLVAFLETLPPVDLPVIGLTRSWQLTFFIVGAPGLLLSALAFTLREPLRRGAAGPHTGASAAVVWRFLVQNRAFFLLHFAGFLCLALQGWTLFGWVVEFFIREHGMGRAEIGGIYGLIVLVMGVSGSVAAGRLATQMLRRGTADAVLRLVVVGAFVMAPLSVAMALVPMAWLALALLAPITFFMAWPPGLGVAAIQAISPNRIHGRIIAVYLVLANLLSIGLGPLLVGVLNDRVFRSEAALGHTLAAMAAVTYPLAGLALLACLKPFRAALAAAETAA